MMEHTYIQVVLRFFILYFSESTEVHEKFTKLAGMLLYHLVHRETFCHFITLRICLANVTSHQLIANTPSTCT